MRSARWLAVVVFVACSASLLPAEDPQAPAPRLIVRPVSDDFRKSLKLDPFYQKQTDYKGLPILASGKVSDEGLAEARYLIGQMLASRDDVTAALVKNRCRFIVMAPTEMTTDVRSSEHDAKITGMPRLRFGRANHVVR